mmetsp:Transcript_82213/g.232819  ORF Transcript_82213/g.232819 Transcript_82213/m.232819 type:complete len:252 (-) Transcript_82213:341-1096(-)
MTPRLFSACRPLAAATLLWGRSSWRASASTPRKWRPCRASAPSCSLGRARSGGRCAGSARCCHVRRTRHGRACTRPCRRGAAGSRARGRRPPSGSRPVRGCRSPTRRSQGRHPWPRSWRSPLPRQRWGLAIWCAPGSTATSASSRWSRLARGVSPRSGGASSCHPSGSGRWTVVQSAPTTTTCRRVRCSGHSPTCRKTGRPSSTRTPSTRTITTRAQTRRSGIPRRWRSWKSQLASWRSAARPQAARSDLT